LKRKVSDTEFNAQLKNKNSVISMKSASKNYNMSVDDKYSCELVGLWNTLRKYEPDHDYFFKNLNTEVGRECYKHVKHEYKHQSSGIYPDITNSNASHHSKTDDIMIELEPDVKEIIKYRFFDRMSFKEIGEQYGCGKTWAKVKTDRAIEKIRKDNCK